MYVQLSGNTTAEVRGQRATQLHFLKAVYLRIHLPTCVSLHISIPLLGHRAYLPTHLPT